MCVRVCVHVRVCAVGKMAKDIGMTIRKSIVVSFLPCLVAFLAFHPYMFFHFFLCFFLLLSPLESMVALKMAVDFYSSLACLLQSRWNKIPSEGGGSCASSCIVYQWPPHLKSCSYAYE